MNSKNENIQISKTKVFGEMVSEHYEDISRINAIVFKGIKDTWV